MENSTSQKPFLESTLGLILLLIIFFPVGLLLMWFKGTWPKRIKWLVTAPFILLLVAGIFGSTQKPTTASNQTTLTATTTTTLTPTIAAVGTIVSIANHISSPTPSTPMILEDRIKSKLKLGEDTPVTEVSTEPDVDLATDKELPGKTAVLISYHMNGTYLDTSWTKQGSWNIDTGIIKDIFPLDNSINTIIMNAQVPVTNAYGKNTYDMLDTVTISRDTYTQINFAKFDPKNIPSIADHYTENHNIKD